jgi:AAA+ ATPase superfamily predicted ATPase
MYAGVGTHFIPQTSIASFISDVESSTISLDSLLTKYAGAVPADKPETKLKSFLPTRRALIDRVFTVQRFEEVAQNLEKELQESKDEGEKKWIQDVQKQLSTKSPTSLLVSENTT